jgi:hypothetical protein
MNDICPQYCHHHDEIIKLFGNRQSQLAPSLSLALVFPKINVSTIGQDGMSGFFTSDGLKLMDQAGKRKDT